MHPAGAEQESQEPQNQPERVGDLLELDEIHVQFAPDLVSMALDPATGLDARILSMREHIARGFGLILPEIRLTDRDDLPTGTYSIQIQGVEHARDHLETDALLLLKSGDESGFPAGQDVAEPVYGAPARWISPRDRDAAVVTGATVVTPGEVLATHLLETLKKNLSRLLSFKALQRHLDAFTDLSDPTRSEANRRMLNDLVPEKVPMDILHSILRLLLAEQVSIRNLPLILEAIAEVRPALTGPDLICEHVRQRLGFQLVSDLKRDDGTVPLVQLAGQWEDIFKKHEVPSEGGIPEIALTPDLFNALARAVGDKISSAAEKGTYAAVVTSSLRRRFLRTVLLSRGILNPVLSFEEIGLEAKPSLVGVAAP